MNDCELCPIRTIFISLARLILGPTFSVTTAILLKESLSTLINLVGLSSCATCHSFVELVHTSEIDCDLCPDRFVLTEILTNESYFTNYLSSEFGVDSYRAISRDFVFNSHGPVVTCLNCDRWAHILDYNLSQEQDS